MHLSTVDDGTVRIAAEQKAIDVGLCAPAIATRSPALVDGGSLAYFTTRRAATPGRWDLGAIGHGPAGQRLAARIIEQIGEWDGNRTADPELFAYPAGTPVPAGLSGKVNVIVKPNIRLALRYPPLA